MIENIVLDENIIVCQSFRTGGYSKDSYQSLNIGLHVGDNPETVIKNRKLICDKLNIKLDQLVFCNQTHSNNVMNVTIKDKGRGALSVDDAIPDCDAIYTTDSNVGLCVMTADCVPIIVSIQEIGLIGAIHSGWVGTAKEIIIKFFEEIQKNYPFNIEQVKVYLGPSYTTDNFEVGQDVIDRFLALDYNLDHCFKATTNNKYYLKNNEVILKQLEVIGISKSNIISDKRCTYLNNDQLFSYRKDRNCGRQMTLVIKK